MKYSLFLVIAFAVMFVSCKQKHPFDASRFLEIAGRYQMLDEREKAIAVVNIASIPEPGIRSASGVCKRINLRTTISELNLDAVNPDSNFSYLKYFREQLSQRSRPNPKGPVYLKNNDIARGQYEGFIKELYTINELSSPQYARLLEKLRQEPVVYPFIIYEWLETMP